MMWMMMETPDREECQDANSTRDKRYGGLEVVTSSPSSQGCQSRSLPLLHPFENLQARQHTQVARTEHAPTCTPLRRQRVLKAAHFVLPRPKHSSVVFIVVLSLLAVRDRLQKRLRLTKPQTGGGARRRWIMKCFRERCRRDVCRARIKVLPTTPTRKAIKTTS